MNQETMFGKSIKKSNERKKVMKTFSMSIIFILAGIFLKSKIISFFPLHSNVFKKFHAVIGSFARALFFMAIILYPLRLILKKFKFSKKFKIQLFFNFFREWHVPMANLGIAFTIIHVFYAILNGYHFNASYISGTIAFFLLIFLSATSFIKNNLFTNVFHRWTAIIFVIIFIIHTAF